MGLYGDNGKENGKYHNGLYEPLSKLPASPLMAPILVPYIIFYITPVKVFRQWLIYRVLWGNVRCGSEVRGAGF